MRSVASALSPAGERGSLLVLTYHRVLPEPDPMLPDEPDARTFAAQMDLVRELFQVLTVSEAADRLRTGTLPARAACITFDDGYANNRQIAAPILQERGLRATFFVTVGYLGGGRMFNDTVIESMRVAPETFDLRDLGLDELRLPDAAARRSAAEAVLTAIKYVEPEQRRKLTETIASRTGKAMPTSLMMSETQVRELAELGMEVGAHSVGHPILTRVDAGTARREIEDSKTALERMTGRPVRSFAYPNGRPGRDYDRSHVEMVGSAGFDAAVSTGWGRATATTDRLQIPRIAPWDRTARRFGARMIRTYLQPPAQGV